LLPERKTAARATAYTIQLSATCVSKSQVAFTQLLVAFQGE
jgi:hypothetical protein